MSKHWAPDLDQFFMEGETPEARRAVLECFLQLARESEQIPPLMLAFVAEGVSRYLEGARDPWPNAKGRPVARQTDWQTWAAWFAVRCDPQFADLPLSTVNGRFDAVREKLRLPVTSARQVQNLVTAYEGGHQVPPHIVLFSFWTDYARRMGWPETEATYQRMTAWLPARN